MKSLPIKLLYSGLCIFLISMQFSFAQEKALTDTTFQGIKLRGIGPALMSGRIADVAIHPEDDNCWYVAVGSGGVWKTKNAGVTWKPIFDDQPTYSIGCVTIDAKNPNIIWVGTGENVGGRHVGFGDGIYKSEDGGNSWKNMGLKETQHISKVIVHPENSNIIWVAAQGPLWNKGEERGLYKSIDGGTSWKKTLGDPVWTGVTDIVIDPRNPDVLYAATWQRHRNVAAYIGGGPGSGIHKSTDGGETWNKLAGGLPSTNMGKIGLAISPIKPDVIYAVIELDRRTGGVWRSTDKGATWEKRSNAVSGATGPHYYQELYASPHQFDKIYIANVRMLVSSDGGKTFSTMKEEHKHSDNHSLAFRSDDPDYLLVGSDGGMYESFDNAENWRFMANLPLTQYYKVAVDDAEPFYNIYGGTQDNSTQGGPSRTDNVHGIRNADWFLTVFADGHQPATEPGNPNIVYSEWQEGNLVRTDRATGEIVYIKPQPAENEPPSRHNWDSPILVSPHNPTTIFFASQRVWKSENRGDSWVPISGDLTRNQERMTLPIMGKQQSWDEAWDMWAMSMYNTITSLAESPVKQGLIYAGTDDGIIQVTEDGGESWRKIEVDKLPDVPETAFVNDIKADLYDENTVYIALDNHKFGDLKPYLYKSTNKGKSWKSMTANLPEKTLVWRIVQDHVKPELMFLATEFGIYFTLNAGEAWHELKGDVPTISFRDLAIQKRENDLVGASFGRGFYVFDDYSFLRECSADILQKEASLFNTRKAWWYLPRGVIGFGEGKGAMGADYYTAPNPPFGAVLTYYLSDDIKTAKEIRKEAEKKLRTENADIPFPGWDAIEKERRQEAPILWITITDNNGNVVRKIKAPAKKGFHRVAWDLKSSSSSVVRLAEPKEAEEDNVPAGPMVAPGTYTATLSKLIDGKIVVLSGPVNVEVERLYNGTLAGSTPDVTAKFWKETDELSAEIGMTTIELQNAMKKAKAMQRALDMAEIAPGDLDTKLSNLVTEIYDLDEQLNGNRSKQEVGAINRVTASQRLGVAMMGTRNATYGPTSTHKENFELAKNQHSEIRAKVKTINEVEIPELVKELAEAGAPNVEGFMRD